MGLTTMRIQAMKNVLVLLLVFKFCTCSNISHVGFPNCVEFTLAADEFEISPGQLLTILGSEDSPLTIDNYHLSENKEKAFICFPLSRHFRQCRLISHLPTSVIQMTSNHSVTDIRTGQRWPLGEYFPSPNDTSIIVCQKCNFIQFRPEEYSQRLADEFVITASNRSFTSPTYSVDPITRHANVCYPLDPSRDDCVWAYMETWESKVLPDKRLQDKPTKATYDLDRYYNISSTKFAVCIDAYVPSDEYRHLRSVCTVAFVVSAACLAVALLIHLALPDLSLQRAPIICHAFSFMILNLSWALHALLLDVVTYTSCYALFYIQYVSALTSFTWLTVLAFDVWRISCCLKDGGKGYNWANSFFSCKFLWYSLFGWGIPALFTTFVAVLDYSYSLQELIGLHPQIASQCWFNGGFPTLYLWYIPFAILIFIDFICFFVSVFNLCCASRNDRPFANILINQELLLILFLIFMVLGGFWVMEIVSYIEMFLYNVFEKWIMVDIINAFQGVVIALVYICTPFLWRNKSQF